MKAELAARKIVVRGRGRSDTVSLVGAEPVQRPKGPSRNGQGMYPELFDKLRKLRNEMAHMTVQAQIVAYAEAIGWTVVSQEEAEQRRGFDQDVPIRDRDMNRSLFLDDLFDGKIRECNPVMPKLKASCSDSCAMFMPTTMAIGSLWSTSTTGASSSNTRRSVSGS